MADQPAAPHNGPNVAARHRDYETHVQDWERCRDAVKGERAVKAKGTRYLPYLTGAEDDEYEAYKERAEYFTASYRTVQGLAGAVTRKPATVEWPASLQPMLGRMGNGGESLDLLTSMTLEEALTTGRVGLYVDAAPGENSEAYVAIYHAENVINWRSEPGPDGRRIFTLIVLKEEADADDGDPYESRCVTRYRVLRLGDGDEPGKAVYTVDLYEEREQDAGQGKKETVYLQVDGYPKTPKGRGGKPLTMTRGDATFATIPFVFIGPSGITGDIEKSPILDLVNVNISHYRTSADLEHGRHWVSLPTPYAVGVRMEGKFRVGSSTFVTAEDPAAKFGMLEFTGAGLESLERAQEQKEHRMAILGARLLEGQKSGQVEAAQTIKLRSSGEHGVLANVATSVSEGITAAMAWVRDWMGGTGEASLTLSQDFNATSMDAIFLNGLLGAYIQGTISYATYFYNLQRGELLPPGVTEDAERGLIADGGPMRTPTPGSGGGTMSPGRSRGGEDAADLES